VGGKWFCRGARWRDLSAVADHVSILPVSGSVPDCFLSTLQSSVCSVVSYLTLCREASAQGLYPDAPKIPCVVGYEVSGTVDAVGPGSGQSWIDRDVFALTRFGGYSDVVVVPEKHVFPTRFPTNRPRQSQLTTSLRGSCSWSWAR
jgi:hypothetical protein